jgi:hypothetical protein
MRDVCLFVKKKNSSELMCYYGNEITILSHIHVKALRMIVDAPWYVPNTVIRRDLQIPTVKEEIRRYKPHGATKQAIVKIPAK